MPTEKETVEEVKDEVTFEIELSDEVVEEVKKSVLESNSGKAEHELEAEIEAAKVARLEAMKEENKEIIAKAAELAKLPDNEGKTEDELFELAQKAVAESHPEDDEPVLGEDFFGELVKKETKEPVDNDSVKTELPEEIKAELEEYRRFKEDAGFRAYVEAKKAGDIDFIGMIAQSGLAFDPKQLTPVQLKQYELNQLKESDPSITDDQIQEAMDDFNDKSPIEKVRDTRAIRAEIEAQQKEALKQFSTKITSDAGASKESFVKTVQEAETALKTDYLGKTFFGVKLDEARLNSVLNDIRSNGVTQKKADGSPDIKKAIEEKLITKNIYDVVNSAYAQGVKAANMKNARKQGKPLGLKARSSASPKQVISQSEKLREAQKLAGMSVN